MSDRDTRVFVWLTGQDFNVGDSALRRPYVAALAGIGCVDAWVGPAGLSYVTGLAVDRDRVHIEPSFRRWTTGLAWSILRRKTIVALNAGEIRQSRARAAVVFALVIGGALARLRGGGLVWIGGSYYGDSSLLARLPYSMAARTAVLLRWREPRSNALFGRGDVGPDWVFAEPHDRSAIASPPRSQLAIVLRGDRQPPSDDWFEWIRKLANAHGLQCIVVVQVESDADRAAEIANRLGGSVLEWVADDEDHRVQEQRARSAYAKCRIVVGDRLHGLIFAATEGAVPLGWFETSHGKIGKHFEPLALPFVSQFEGVAATSYPVPTEQEISEWSLEIASAVDAASTDWARYVKRMHELR